MQDKSELTTSGRYTGPRSNADLGARVVKEAMKEDLKEIHWEAPNRHLIVKIDQ